MDQPEDLILLDLLGLLLLIGGRLVRLVILCFSFSNL